MILSHCRWTAMVVMNIVFRWQWTLMVVMDIALQWQWTLMAVMTIYKRINELQRWQTTPTMMNSTDEPASFNNGELHRQLWTCLFQCRICSPQENVQKSCCRCCGSFLYQHQKSLELQLSLILRCGVHVPMFMCSSHRIIPSRDFSKKASPNACFHIFLRHTYRDSHLVWWNSTLSFFF